LYFKGKNLIKEDRVLDDTAPGIVSKYTVDFEYDSKKSFYAILGYSKLMDHNDLVSLNNKRSVVQESSTNAASQTYLLLNFLIVFLNTTRMAILWSSLRKQRSQDI
jgi:hypothetical protein